MEPPLQNLALLIPAILPAGAGGTAENRDCHPGCFRDTQVWGPGRTCVNKGSTRAMQLPPCLQPQGAGLWHTRGAYDRAEHHRKKWKTTLRREICCSCCIVRGWEGGKGVRERLGKKSKCQHYLELANCWRDYRGIFRMVVGGCSEQCPGAL